MFRRRNNIIKQAGKRLAPNSKQIKSIFQNFIPNLVDEEKHQKPNVNLDNDLKANKQERKRNESYYRDKLAKSLNGQTEIRVPTGRIDILTENQIIEVKHIKKWKDALGQIIAYGDFYPHLQKRIHLFGVRESNTQILLITEQCQKQNIIVTFEE